MRASQRLALFLLLPFAAYSTWVMWEIGYFGIWKAGFKDLGSGQILWDLAICCVLICAWLKHDAQTRGMNPYPWWLATLTTGSLAPLVYLIVRKQTDSESASPARQQHSATT